MPGTLVMTVGFGLTLVVIEGNSGCGIPSGPCAGDFCDVTRVLFGARGRGMLAGPCAQDFVQKPEGGQGIALEVQTWVRKRPHSAR